VTGLVNFASFLGSWTWSFPEYLEEGLLVLIGRDGFECVLAVMFVIRLIVLCLFRKTCVFL